MKNRVLVIAPHPDDEVLGVGGTIAKHSNDGNEIFVTIITIGDDELYSKEQLKISRTEAKEAHKILGVKETFFLNDFPAAKLDTVPHYKLNKEIKEIIDDIIPDILYIPFYGDIHKDHKLVFESAMVAVRPIVGNYYPKAIYSYETLSESNWNAPYIIPSFIPNFYNDISNFIDKKIEALSMFKSQLKEFPNERSLESVIALSNLRGSTVGVKHAEAFILIREIK